MTRVIGTATVLLLALGLTACSPPAPGPPPTASSEPAVPAEESCAELSDIGTLVFNARSSQRAGRLLPDELDGVMRVAARLLHRVPVEPGTPLAESVAELRALIPAVPVGAQASASDGTELEEWDAVFSSVSTDCVEAGIELFGIEGWVGG